MRTWNHRRCASHTPVDGAGRVCVLPGQDADDVVGFARAMAAAGAGRRIPRPGTAKAAPTAEKLRHVTCTGHVDGFGGRLCVPAGSTADEVEAFALEVAVAADELSAAIAARIATAHELAAAGAWPAADASMGAAVGHAATAQSASGGRAPGAGRAA